MAQQDNNLSDSLRAMSVHERRTFLGGDPPNVIVLRVPNGWIYEIWDKNRQHYADPVFVLDVQSIEESINRLRVEINVLRNELSKENGQA